MQCGSKIRLIGLNLTHTNYTDTIKTYMSMTYRKCKFDIVNIPLWAMFDIFAQRNRPFIIYVKHFEFQSITTYFGMLFQVLSTHLQKSNCLATWCTLAGIIIKPHQNQSVWHLGYNQ